MSKTSLGIRTLGSDQYVEMKGWNVTRKILLYVEMFKIVLAEGMIKSYVGLFIM